MKYRGLTYNKEKESYEWVYGLPSYGYATDEVAEIGTVYGDFREIFPDTLGEQTPYRDKNGKEIYTGDIVALEVDGQIREFVVDKATVDREYNTLQGFTGKDGSNTVKVRLGKESFAGMLAIVNASEADFNKLTDAVYNCDGAAKQMAETKLDNLNGSITLAQSAFDTVGAMLQMLRAEHRQQRPKQP